MEKKYLVYMILLLLTSVLTSCLSRPERIAGTGPHTVKPRHTNTHSTKQLREKYAELIDIRVDEVQNIPLYQYIEEWMGTPHRLGGGDKRGIDCSAFTHNLVQSIYEKSLPRTADDMAQVIKRKYEGQLKEGDLVFFNFNGQGKFDHVGVYLGNDRFVHVSTSKGVVISNLKDPWYRKYFTRAGSI